jgi:hypothetical protein
MEEKSRNVSGDMKFILAISWKNNHENNRLSFLPIKTGYGAVWGCQSEETFALHVHANGRMGLRGPLQHLSRPPSGSL